MPVSYYRGRERSGDDSRLSSVGRHVLDVFIRNHVPFFDVLVLLWAGMGCLRFLASQTLKDPRGPTQDSQNRGSSLDEI